MLKTFMWFFAFQLAVVGLVVYQVNTSCWSCSVNTIVPFLPITAGHYALCQITPRAVPYLFVYCYYALFWWFLDLHGWWLALYYVPAFIGNFLALELLPGPRVYGVAGLFALARFVPYTWIPAAVFGMHSVLIASFMLLITNGKRDNHTFSLLYQYFSFSARIWAAVTQYIL